MARRTSSETAPLDSAGARGLGFSERLTTQAQGQARRGTTTVDGLSRKPGSESRPVVELLSPYDYDEYTMFVGHEMEGVCHGTKESVAVSSVEIIS